MKKVTLLVATGLVLVSVAAFAQMQHGRGGHDGAMPGRGPMSHDMHAQMMMHGPMMHQQQMGGMHDRGHSGAQSRGDTGPSSLAFRGINDKMHAAMNIAFTGNADVDFVKGMIPHHQGAIDMAKTVLAFGKDPEVRKLAEEIIKAQEAEIASMNEWLRKRGQ
jgi:uncharacterized protein (DUF305 family)